jgi:ATP phosphoribosyltransferase
VASLIWPPEQADAAERATEGFLDRGASRRANGLLVPTGALFEVSAALAEAGVGPVSVTRPDYVFEASSPAGEALAARVGA